MVAVSYFVVDDTPLRRGGGEPSLASREDPYGSLRMPLSICVILRIYNEDAIRVSFLLLAQSASTSCVVLSFSFPLSFVLPRSPACHPSSLLLLALGYKGIFVIIAVASIAPIGERADVSRW